MMFYIFLINLKSKTIVLFKHHSLLVTKEIVSNLIGGIVKSILTETTNSGNLKKND